MLTSILLVFARIAGLVFTAPLLGSRAVGIWNRCAITILLTIVSCSSLTLSGTGGLIGADLTMTGELVSQALSEVCIGVALGLGTLIIFSSAHMAGSILGQLAGLSFFGSLDPTSGENGSSVATLFGLTSMAAFVLMNGPEMVVSSVLHSFTTLPAGTATDPTGLLELVPELLQQSFILALGGIGPGIAAIFATSLAFGFVCRVFPQMNLTALAIGSNTAMMFGAIFLTLGGCMWLFMDDLVPTLQSILERIQLLGGTQ